MSGGLMCYLYCLCLFAYSDVKYVLAIRVTLRVSYKRQELLTLREHLGSPPVFGGSRFLVFVVVCVCVICFVLCLVYPMLSVSLVVHSLSPFGFL